MINMSRATVNQFTELEVAMKKHAEFIVVNEQRTFSFLDFLHFEVDGMEHTMTHGTFRNKISKLRENGIVEPAFNSGIAFYTLKGVQLGKNNATSLMTPNRIRVLLQHMHRVPNIKKHFLYKIIKNHPFDRAAVHDLQLKFVATGLWYLLSNNNSTSNITLDPISKDIRLENRVINGLEIQTTIHHTDTVTVVVGCSDAPVAADVDGIIKLSDALSIIEEELHRLIQEHVSKSYSQIETELPNHMSWVVTRWDFGTDDLVTYTGEKFFFSWKISLNVLLVIYTKQWGENNCRIRAELREFPNKPLGKALIERLNPKKGS